MQKVILHYGKTKRSLFWSLIIFADLSFTTVRGQKIGFNSFECIKFLNIANIHVLDVWGKCIFICNKKIFFICFFSVCSFCNATFFQSGYIIKPPQPSSTICGALPFTGNPLHVASFLPVWVVAYSIFQELHLIIFPLICSSLLIIFELA